MKSIVIIFYILANLLVIIYATIKRKTGSYSEGYTYELGTSLLVIASIAVCFFSVIFIISFLQAPLSSVFFAIFDAIGLLLLLIWGCKRIVLYNDALECRNFLGITKEYLYSDITKFQVIYNKLNGSFCGYRLYFKSKQKLLFDYSATNSLGKDRLVSFIKKMAKKQGNRLSIEKAFCYPWWL